MPALFRLAPDGMELAENWLKEPLKGRFDWQMQESVRGRAMLLAAMGRPSVEADWLIRLELQRLDSMFAQAGPEADDPPMPVGERFEALGRFGVGGRLAIPRLREYQKHPSPWVRMWATEALDRITSTATKSAKGEL